MVVFISFEEMQGYVAEHYKKEVAFSRVSEKELCVTVTQRIVIKDVHIDVKLHIDEVKSESLAVTYKGGFALDMMISGALCFLKNKLPELSQGITTEENHRICVNLAEIEKAKAVVKSIALRDIEVEEKGLKVTVALK